MLRKEPKHQVLENQNYKSRAWRHPHRHHFLPIPFQFPNSQTKSHLPNPNRSIVSFLDHFLFIMGFENFQPTTHWNFTSDPTGHAFFVTIISLSLLTIFFLGFLIFRLVCHLKRNLPVITSATLTISQHTISIPAGTAAAAASSSLGLDATTINSLPIFIHRSSSEDMEDAKTASYQESECSICLALYEDEETVKVMPECQHAFHSDCVDEWLRSRSTCPLCRLSLDSNSSLDRSSLDQS